MDSLWQQHSLKNRAVSRRIKASRKVLCFNMKRSWRVWSRKSDKTRSLLHIIDGYSQFSPWPFCLAQRAQESQAAEQDAGAFGCPWTCSGGALTLPPAWACSDQQLCSASILLPLKLGIGIQVRLFLCFCNEDWLQGSVSFSQARLAKM